MRGWVAAAFWFITASWWNHQLGFIIACFTLLVIAYLVMTYVCVWLLIIQFPFPHCLRVRYDYMENVSLLFGAVLILKLDGNDDGVLSVYHSSRRRRRKEGKKRKTLKTRWSLEKLWDFFIFERESWWQTILCVVVVVVCGRPQRRVYKRASPTFYLYSTHDTISQWYSLPPFLFLSLWWWSGIPTTTYIHRISSSYQQTLFVRLRACFCSCFCWYCALARTRAYGAHTITRTPPF